MSNFLLKTAAAFAVSFSWVLVAARVAERSRRWGGAVAALPSVTAFSLLFIAWTQDGASAGATARPLPAGIGACAVAACAYVRLARERGVAAALAGSAFAWLCAMVPVAFLNPGRGLFRPAPALVLADAVGLAMIAVSAALLPAAQREGEPKPIRNLGLKAFAGAATVAAAVAAAGSMGALAGAVVASFPSILWTVLVAVHRDLGAAALAAMGRGFMAGLVGGVAFANAAAWLFPRTGIPAAFTISYAASVCVVAGTLAALDSSEAPRRTER